ncbi:MAG: hypothetical protein OEX02_12640 [Cyclobacteriaceae bacterium]|nr:hypothetical protein [Cyclobacteriaceae bacterium]
MKFKMQLDSFDWWIWAITLLFIILAVAGFSEGYYLVIAISGFQIVYVGIREKSLVAFESQVRIMYCALTLVGLWEVGRLYFYVLLLIGTVLVVFFGRCGVALFLRKMPWNKDKFCSLEDRPG